MFLLSLPIGFEMEPPWYFHIRFSRTALYKNALFQVKNEFNAESSRQSSGAAVADLQRRERGIGSVMAPVRSKKKEEEGEAIYVKSESRVFKRDSVNGGRRSPKSKLKSIDE